MPYEFFDHTGDIGVRVTGATVEGVFAEAAVAFADTVTDPARIEERETVHVALRGPALDLLLVDWLNEILYRFDAAQFLTARAKVVLRASGGEHQLDAILQGERLDPARHPVKVLVKAVTYHALDLGKTAEGWRATLVFDI